MKIPILAFLLISTAIVLVSHGQDSTPLRLVQTIRMPNVHGRIDHMALDVEANRLFVAALGNNSLEVLDLRVGKVFQTISGLKEPQGVFYIPELGRLFVATGGDGKCHVYSGDPLRRIATINIGEDADNVRFDEAAKKLYIGYGNGALAVIEPYSLKRLGDIKLEGHPESFQIEKTGPRIFVNVPDAHQLAVVNRVQQAVVATWSLGSLRANFPMALVESTHRLFVAIRNPAKLVALDCLSGRIVSEMDCAGDADDLFYDSSRKLVYISCGAGMVDIFAERDTDHFQEVVRIPTESGARTSLWAPQANQLFLAVPSRAGQEAAVRIYQSR